MDTDDLTSMAYQCILYASEATDVIKAEFGAACSEFKTEDEYLLGLLNDLSSSLTGEISSIEPSVVISRGVWN